MGPKPRSQSLLSRTGRGHITIARKPSPEWRRPRGHENPESETHCARQARALPTECQVESAGLWGGAGAHSKKERVDKGSQGMEKWVLKLARGDQERWEAMRFGLDLVVDYDESILSEARKMG